jgi:hypothetical protein
MTLDNNTISNSDQFQIIVKNNKKIEVAAIQFFR